MANSPTARIAPGFVLLLDAEADRATAQPAGQPGGVAPTGSPVRETPAVPALVDGP